LYRGTQVAITGVEGGDNTINAAEAAGGIVITGTAEAGSNVLVKRRHSHGGCGRHLHGHPAGSDRGWPAGCDGDVDRRGW
jgi:hypothetical protein